MNKKQNILEFTNELYNQFSNFRNIFRSTTFIYYPFHLNYHFIWQLFMITLKLAS